DTQYSILDTISLLYLFYSKIKKLKEQNPILIFILSYFFYK
ncbi:unnamed protein product, partial [marine sediment metagenome]